MFIKLLFSFLCLLILTNKVFACSSEMCSEQKTTKKLPKTIEAELITGASAPVIIKKDTDRVPLLAEVKDISDFQTSKEKIAKCLLLVKGSGNLEDERAYLTPEKLECINAEGEIVFQKDIKGYVTDSDGVPGLKGDVITENGSEFITIKSGQKILSVIQTQ